jgi:hypothetical protein
MLIDLLAARIEIRFVARLARLQQPLTLCGGQLREPFSR